MRLCECEHTYETVQHRLSTVVLFIEFCVKHLENVAIFSNLPVRGLNDEAIVEHSVHTHDLVDLPVAAAG